MHNWRDGIYLNKRSGYLLKNENVKKATSSLTMRGIQADGQSTYAIRWRRDKGMTQQSGPVRFY